MRLRSIFCSTVCSILFTLPVFASAQQDVSNWVTTRDGAHLLEKQAALAWRNPAGAPDTITVDDTKTFQTMEGFGHALTGGSAQLLMKMSPAARASLLQELFGSGASDVHTSYLRLTVGASDMNDRVYTYDDLPRAATDPSLAHFSIKADEADVIPVLHQILLIEPHLHLLASPWTAPAWMKTNGAFKAGALKPAGSGFA